MTDLTTIQVTKKQKNELDALKTGSKESYKDVLQRLIEHYNDEVDQDCVDEDRAREIANDVVEERVVFEALE